MVIKASTGFLPISYSTDRPLDPRDEYSGVGDGASHPLSSVYGSLAAAQAKYPHATALTDEIDWCALQGVINASISTGNPATVVRNGIRQVVIPGGKWVLNKPLSVTGVLDFEMVGMGPTSQLVLGGIGLTAMIDLNGTADCVFRDFSIVNTLNAASHTCQRAMWLRWTGTARSSTQNSFSDITVRNIHWTRAAVEIGDDGANNQVDNTTWSGVNVTGDARWHGPAMTDPTADVFLVGHNVAANNLLHNFNGCMALRGRYGVNVAASEVTWVGGSLQNNWVADVYVSGVGHNKFYGFRSEHSGSLLRTAGPASYPGLVELSGVVFNAVTADLQVDRRLIDWKLGGSLLLTNVRVANPSSEPLVVRTEGTGNVAVVSTGLSVQDRTMAQVFTVNGTTSNIVVAYVNVNAAGSCTGVESNLGGGSAPAQATVSITGDGTTLDFTVPHNLALTTPFQPSSVTVLDPAGNLLSLSSYDVDTLTANDFTVRFTVAPANGAVHRFRITA